MLSKWPNHTHFRIDGLFKLKKELLPKYLLLRKVLLLKVCELQENTFPKVREGDNDDSRGAWEQENMMMTVISRGASKDDDDNDDDSEEHGGK